MLGFRIMNVNAYAGLLIMTNLFSFLLFGWDKRRAVHHDWRIPEYVLFLSACMMAGIGAFCGMRVFHHKTKKNLFRIGIPLLSAVQILLLICCLPAVL